MARSDVAGRGAGAAGARREAALELQWDGETVPFRSTAVLQANEPDADRRRARGLVLLVLSVLAAVVLLWGGSAGAEPPRELDPGHPLYGQVRGVVVTRTVRGSAAARAGLQAEDDLTMVFKLNDPATYFVDMLTLTAFSPAQARRVGLISGGLRGSTQASAGVDARTATRISSAMMTDRARRS